jgi:diketogulonate reductase-like aldo/keto reductase
MGQLRIPTVTLNTGHALPLLGLGTWPLNDDEAAAAVAAALAQGYRLVDTAARYCNEGGVGRGIAAAGLPRAALFVTTKLRGRDHGYAETKDALRRSLVVVQRPRPQPEQRQRVAGIQRDRRDLSLFHRPPPSRSRTGSLRRIMCPGPTPTRQLSPCPHHRAAW